MLLAEPAPPSIVIVSFNLTQKDLIEEELDRAADADPEFRERLDTARTRQRNGGFEGLFVKNLENVQGDERDVIVISTTYGPTPEGKFFRRFGPLGQAVGASSRLDSAFPARSLGYGSPASRCCGTLCRAKCMGVGGVRDASGLNRD